MADIITEEGDMINETVWDAVNYDSQQGNRPLGYIGVLPDSPDLPQNPFAALQFTGLCIYLYPDGTWRWEDTTGG